ncbi:uncharacterized protein LOC107416703 isoform X1 [Ziziphus jujuba]|uniref:Uncharacterized protein LOC107416703 isoform X1 n=2 Tax=Ziziphus jujuba TaxID=326968 RepID=A0A6P3ZNZ3_ZIZJJ|nr:uncharacterized protein LOC107416703 isoform X1 [Ziziphus jujuba]
MGKRKERRLAAMSNAGRRVKLDLFAEPSGDLGGSTVHDEVGADVDSKHSAGLPKSPSSSGLQPENPLLLLGQYSDDELEEDSNERPNNGAMENSSPANDENVMGPPGEGSQHVDVNVGDDHATSKVKERKVEKHSASPDVNQNHEGGDKEETDATTSCDFHKDLDFTEQAGTSYTHPLGDVSSGWQIVMHEESNQYYYWNTETGETSWDIPEVLSQVTEMASEQKTPAVSAGMEKASVDTKNSNLTLSVKLDSSAAKTTEGTSNLMYGHEYQPPQWNAEKTEVGNDVINSGASAFDPLSGDGSSTTAGSEKFMSDTLGCEEETDLSLNLVKYCEFLLERLKSLKGSKARPESLDCISKYILEVEIRLADIKSLLLFGSSLLPFWVHSEKQLKILESLIKDEASKIANAAQIDKVEANDISLFREEDKLQRSSRHESQVDGTGNNVSFSTLENSHVSTTSADIVTVIPKDPDANASSANCELVSSLGSPTKNIERFSSEQVRGDGCPYESKAGEDVDMDVDMEVEDANSAGNEAIGDVSGAKEFSQPKQPNHPNPPVANTSIVVDDAFPAPPPQDEEWIPPPPPDNELVPPPPPDDPPEPLYHLSQSYPATGQPSYAEQYNMSYPNTGYEYYGHSVVELPSGSFYGHADGSQVAIPQAPIYYGAVPNTYTETAQVIVNPADPVPYYEMQDGTLPPAPVVSCVEAPRFHTEAAPVSSGFVVSFVEAGQNSLSTTSGDNSTVGGDTERATMDVLSSTATIQASATVSTKEAVPVLQNNAGSSAATVAGTSAVTKVQSKVTRNKKRTVAVAPSLRSNKKVSSLVDKWKAAKEELLEDEKEPENAYEMLERKRQREIEEWHAQQIASGEAKDNANFQPLGGDWRERVKRRRAQLASETAQTQTEAPNDENQQPDLTEISKDLPSGWQAFWDESSKQVYYGNVLTSETTWTRPSK